MAPVNGTLIVNSRLAFGTTEFSCDRGYSLVGDRTLHCTLNETWSSPVPTCNGGCLPGILSVLTFETIKLKDFPAYRQVANWTLLATEDLS